MISAISNPMMMTEIKVTKHTQKFKIELHTTKFKRKSNIAATHPHAKV
jgi:hypothetical protein